MKVSILIPCKNEEKSISPCIKSCLNQSYKPHQIIVIDDASTDKTPNILQSYAKEIDIITLLWPSGGKSRAQEVALHHMSGDIFITTDADTLLHKDFIKNIVKEFKDNKVYAVAGYVKSLKFNPLTACRELDYLINQNIHKIAQGHINSIFVVPGCAGAFRTGIFNNVELDHDTVTEDIDITFKLHSQNRKIAFCKKAICYTQDPSTITSYIAQQRRWYTGGWQNILKHKKTLMKQPGKTLEFTLIYVEGLLFSFLVLLVPIISMSYFRIFIIPYLSLLVLVALFTSIKEKRFDLIASVPVYVGLTFLNSILFIESFFKEVVLKKKNLDWVQPERRAIT